MAVLFTKTRFSFAWLLKVAYILRITGHWTAMAADRSLLRFETQLARHFRSGHSQGKCRDKRTIFDHWHRYHGFLRQSRGGALCVRVQTLTLFGGKDIHASTKIIKCKYYGLHCNPSTMRYCMLRCPAFGSYLLCSTCSRLFLLNR